MTKCASFVVLAMLVAASGCASSAGTAISTELGENFRLPYGQSATVEGGALEIVFEAVETDSRCPKGEACVWEGDAIVRISMQGATGAKKEERELHTSSKGPATTDYGDWSIRLVALEPFPVTGRTIAQASYVAVLQVVHGSTATSESQ